MIELWHRKIKQGYGFGDCKCNKFSAIAAHVNLCLTAYCLHELMWDGSIAPKFTASEYQQMQELQKAKARLNLFGGRQRIKDLAAAELQKFMPAA